MSNIYIQEPPTNGKVLLHTSIGDIDVELWSKEAPRACRNFVQLCMEGYYNGTIFHRVIKDFIAQGGDPTGTGHGGESIYGKPFKDEFHSRLRFNRRGLVGMANAGPNDNSSQFFFTLAAAPELDKKHTLFAKVSGNTVYNMLKLGDLVTDSNERPMDPPRINRTKVLMNPFEDIIPRIKVKHKDPEAEEKKKKKSKSGRTKNFSLLSFGEEAEEDEVEVIKASKDLESKPKSSHDLLPDKKLSTVPAIDTEASSEQGSKRSAPSDDENEDEKTESDSEEKEIEKSATLDRIKKKLKKDRDPKEGVEKDLSEEEADAEISKNTKLQALKKEAKQLKKEIRGDTKDKSKEPDEKPEKAPINDVIADYEETRKKYAEKKPTKNKSSREEQTLAILAKFQTKLSSARMLTTYDDDDEEEIEEESKKEEEEEKEEDDEDPTDVTWMNHRLKFDSNSKKVLDANIADADRYEIFDPRNPMNQRRREASKQAMKDRR